MVLRRLATLQTAAKPKRGNGHANENSFHCSISLLFGRPRRLNNKTEIEPAIFPEFLLFSQEFARAFFRASPHELISLPPGIIRALLRSILFGPIGISTARASARRARTDIFYKISKL